MKRFISISVLAFLTLAALPLLADQMIPLTVEQLSIQSQLILHGKIVSQTVQRDPEGRIYTTLDLQVDEVWKGNLATNHFNIVRGGGTLGDEISTVSGEAEYALGEEVVSFLVLNKRGEGVGLGLSQGKFTVWSDPATGEKLTHNRFHGLQSSKAVPPAQSLVGPPILNRLTLAELKQRALGGAK